VCEGPVCEWKVQWNNAHTHTNTHMQPKHDRKLPGGNFMSIVERHLKVKQTLPRPKGIFRCQSVCV